MLREVRVKSDPAPSTALVTVAPRETVNVWDDLRLQKLWLGSTARLAIARGPRHEPVPRDLRGRRAPRAARLAISWPTVQSVRPARPQHAPARLRGGGDARADRVGYATRRCAAIDLRDPTAGPIAKQTDAVLLCIALGETSFKSAEETIAAVGRDRVIGSIVLRPRNQKTPAPVNGT